MAAAARTTKKSETSPPWDKDEEKKDQDEKATQKASVDVQIAPRDDDDDEDEDDDDLDDEALDLDDEDDDEDEDDDDDEKYGKSEASDDDEDDEKKKDEASKAESDDEDEDDDKLSRSEDEETCDMTEKSMRVSEASLRKALRLVSRITQNGDPSSRKQALLVKAARGSVTEAERRELYSVLGGVPERRADLARRVTKSFREDSKMKKSMQTASDADVSGYLEALNESIVKSLRVMAKSTDAASGRQHEVSMVMCKALAQIGGTVLAMGRRLNVIESQPARQPKSISARPVQKSFAGEPSEATQPAAGEMIEILTEMNRASHASGRNGLSKSQHSISDAVNTLLSSGAVPKGIVPDVIEFRKSQRAGA